MLSNACFPFMGIYVIGIWFKLKLGTLNTRLPPHWGLVGGLETKKRQKRSQENHSILKLSYVVNFNLVGGKKSTSALC
jgi:hypothetical protein